MIPDPIVVEQSLPADPEVVWRAITDPALMRQWYFEAIEEFRPEVGFETAFDVDAGRRIFGHRWRVTEATPGRRLTYTWRYEGFAGEGATVWKLTKIPGGTKLTLVCSRARMIILLLGSADVRTGRHDEAACKH